MGLSIRCRGAVQRSEGASDGVATVGGVGEAQPTSPFLGVGVGWGQGQFLRCVAQSRGDRIAMRVTPEGMLLAMVVMVAAAVTAWGI